MGSGSTKIISYDDASKRFLPADLERIETTFRDLTSGTGELSYTSFKRDVFAHFLPEKLAARLYQVCTSSSKSCMSLKDLVCCLALIYYGTPKERMQLLYLLFAHDVSNSNGTLRWQDVEVFLSQCGDHPPEELDTIFQNHDEVVTQDKFLSWLGHHQGHTTTITDWLMDDQRLHELTLSPVERTLDQYSILAGVTHLSEIEIRELEKSYFNLCTYSSANRQQQITLQTFSNILTPVLPPMLIPGFFDAFDENCDECIDFKEFVCGLSAACRGPQYERYKFLFHVFDRDHDGRLDRCDIVHMSSCLIDVAQFVYAFSIYMNDSPDVYADNILQKIENNESTEIKYFQQEDFVSWCSADPLVKELIELIFQICHVVLGLRPSTKQDEVTIVKQFLRREQYPFVEAQSGVSSKTYHWINCNRSTSKPGSSWYLISMDWWIVGKLSD